MGIPLTTKSDGMWIFPRFTGSMSKVYLDKKEIDLPEGFQKHRRMDGLLFFRLLRANYRSARLAQFMLFLSKSKEKGLNKNTV